MTCAVSGAASGTSMISMLKRTELGSSLGCIPEQPASSLGDLTGAEPET